MRKPQHFRMIEKPSRFVSCIQNNIESFLKIIQEPLCTIYKSVPLRDRKEIDMIDIKYIKEKPDEVVARLAKKGKDAKEDIEAILRLDTERRTLISETETLKAEQDKTNKLIPQFKKEGKDLAPVFAEMKALGAKVKENDDKLKEVETHLQSFLLGLPNLPDMDLLAGGKENN